MFQPKKIDEAESDSDWDSLPGDVPEPSSSPDVTPRPQPAPPVGSPKGQVAHKRPQIKPQAVTGPPEKTSSTNPPANQAKTKPGTPASHMPSQLYGKPGVTNFVDRGSGINTTTFTDRSLDNRKNKELQSPDVHENKVRQTSLGRGDIGIDVEMNEVDSHQQNPPFTDFQAALPKQDSLKLSPQTEKHNKGKVKASYVTNKEVHTGDHSWDSDSGAEQDPVTHSRQHLTPHETNSKKQKEHQVPNDLHAASEAVAVDREADLGLKTCCVPLDTGNQLAGCSYRFDHGHNHQYNVSSEWKEAYMKTVADRSEKWLHYFWQEFFSTVRIITDFAFIFVLELLRFVFHYIALRVAGGIMFVLGDHFLKPFLAVLFNSIIQPSFIFTRNVLAGVKNLLQPLMDITNSFIAQLVSLLRAFRLFELNWKPVYERGQKHDVHVL